MPQPEPPISIHSCLKKLPLHHHVHPKSGKIVSTGRMDTRKRLTHTLKVNMGNFRERVSESGFPQSIVWDGKHELQVATYHWALRPFTLWREVCPEEGQRSLAKHWSQGISPPRKMVMIIVNSRNFWNNKWDNGFKMLAIREWKWKLLSCVRLCNPKNCSPWNSPGQNTEVGSLSLL